MEVFAVVIVFVFTIYVSVPKRIRRIDPMDQGPAVPKPVSHRGSKINRKIENPEWAERFVHHVATSGSPDSLTDEMIRQGIYEIVNNEALSDNTKYHMLDALQMRVWNDHPQGVAAEVIEDIENESIALQYPDANWHGRCGDWESMKGR
jgi:hypothetical protein